MKKLIIKAACMAAVLLAPQAGAVLFSFNNITHNNAANETAGEAQLSVDVNNTGLAANQVRFLFSNAGGVGAAPMVITQIYFDDGELLGISTIENNPPGVEFHINGAANPNLPGGNGNPHNFNPTVNFGVDANNPAPHRGVGVGETLGVIFNLVVGSSFADVLAAIQLSLNTPGVDVVGGLRIGIHVQSFQNGGSESFINGGGGGGGNNGVPDGGSTIALVGIALAGMGALRRTILKA